MCYLAATQPEEQNKLKSDRKTSYKTDLLRISEIAMAPEYLRGNLAQSYLARAEGARCVTGELAECKRLKIAFRQETHSQALFHRP